MKKLIVGNWKMNPQSAKEAETLYKEIQKGTKGTKETKKATIVVCPPFLYLYLGQKFKSTKIHLGAQDVAHEQSGAYTGEVSASMLASMKVSYVIIGHSERRALGESNEMVNTKLVQALKSKLIPIVCVGESIRDAHGEYLAFIKEQLYLCLSGISKVQMKNVVIAYEPIWAISSNNGREAVPQEFVEVRIFIRKVLSDLYGAATAHATPILYGGSVGPTDVSGFLVEGGADGALVGRNSLTAKKFTAIIAAC